MMVAIHNKDLTTKLGRLNMKNFDRTHLAGSYVSKEQPHSKPRKPGRIKIIEN